MSPCLGEPMPVVARSIQILSRTIAVSQSSRTILAFALCLHGTVCFSQENAPAGTQEPAQTEPVPAAVPEPVPAADEKAVPIPEPVEPGCLNQILEQQKLTRTIREIRNPLPRPNKADADKLKRKYGDFLSKGFSGAAETKEVNDYLTYRILQATDPEFLNSPANMQILLRETENDITRCGSTIPNPLNQRSARKLYCAEVLKVLKQLLDNNLDARFAAVTIMPMLHEVRAVQNGAAATLHNDALVALIAVIRDKEQPDSVKAVAANSVRNVLRNCQVVEQDQFRICDAIGDELSRPCCEAAYQVVLLDAVLEITFPRKTVGPPEPTAMKLFAAAIDDQSKPLEVRCHAAMGIGRGSFDEQMTLDPLAWRIATLTKDAAIEFNDLPGDPKWSLCGMNLLLSFRHLAAAETAGAIKDRKGLMNRAEKSSVIASAAPFITMVAVKLAENKAKFSVAEVEQLQALATWIKDNEPANPAVWDKNAPPLKIGK